MGSSVAPLATSAGSLDDDALAEHIAAGLCSRDPLEDTRLAGKYHIELRADGDEAVDRFDATRIADARWVTVEMPTPEVAADPRRRDAFIRLAAAERTLAHRNVLAVIDVGETPDGRPFLVREAADTEPLAYLVARGETLPWTRVRQIALQLCAGVLAARVRGLGVQSLTLEGCRRVRQQQSVDNLKLGPFELLENDASTEHDDVAAIVAMIEQLGGVGTGSAMPPELDAVIGRTRGRAGEAEPCEGVLDLGRALLAIGGGATAWSRARSSTQAGVIEGADAESIDAETMSRAVAAEVAAEPEAQPYPRKSRTLSRTQMRISSERPSASFDAMPVLAVDDLASADADAPANADAPTVAVPTSAASSSIAAARFVDDDAPVPARRRRGMVSAALLATIAAAAVVSVRFAAPDVWAQATDAGVSTVESLGASVSAAIPDRATDRGAETVDVRDIGTPAYTAPSTDLAPVHAPPIVARPIPELGPGLDPEASPDRATVTPSEAVPPGPPAMPVADVTKRRATSAAKIRRGAATDESAPSTDGDTDAAEPVGRAVDEMAPSGVPAEVTPAALPDDESPEAGTAAPDASAAALPEPPALGGALPDVVDRPPQAALIESRDDDVADPAPRLVQAEP